ncbi:MAG: type-F conjugative transfer system protein TraW [Rickettsiales bacterium]|nr:type-F conjugative transfer system protein TraW [Rickettsiales bacterium]
MFKQILKHSFIFLIIPSVCFAKDFGRKGHVFEIVEEDLLKVIARRLNKADIDKLNNDLKEKTKAYVNRPTPVLGIGKTEQEMVFFHDPTYEVKEDIKDHRGNILYKAGYKVNPLKYKSLKEDLIFIDGDDRSQVRFAVDYKTKKAAKIILVKGSPISLQRELKTIMYFDQYGELTSEFKIKQVPAIVSQENLLLRIQELKVEDLTFKNTSGINQLIKGDQ